MKPASASRRSPAEWVTLALSLLVVGSLVVVALMEEANREQEDGASLSIVFDPDHAALRGDSYYVPYSIRNIGADAISSAELWIEVLDDAQLVEAAEVTVQFLPLQGRQDGIFVTVHDPSTHTLRGRLESLQFP